MGREEGEGGAPLLRFGPIQENGRTPSPRGFSILFGDESGEEGGAFCVEGEEEASEKEEGGRLSFEK